MKKITVLGILLAILILLGVEGYAFYTGQEGATISEISWDVVRDYPIVGVFLGIIIGHICWPLTKNIRKKLGGKNAS